MSPRSFLGGTGRVQVPARLLDLSLGGALLSLEAGLEAGSIHDFALDLGRGETVWVQGEVRRCRPSDRGGYQVGVEFVGVAPRDVERLREYLAGKRGPA
jgi:c-di-GMP-binding flagellar brake protein YcgR